MEFLLRFTFRNLWRHRTRTVVTLIAVSFSAMMVFVSFTLLEGSHRDMLVNLLQSARIGAIQVYHPQYKEEPVLWNSVAFDPALWEKVRELPDVEVMAPRIRLGALVAYGMNTVGVGLMGLKWEADSAISPLFLVKGRKLQEGEAGLLISEKLAENLRVEVGDSLLLLTQDAYGAIAVDLFPVGGIYRSGNPDADPFLVLIDLETAQRFLNMPEQVTEVALWTRDFVNPVRSARALRSLLGPRVAVLTWKEDNPDIDQMLKLDSGGQWVIMWVLVFIVTLIILSTLYMNVVERIREFGVMTALGTRPRWIRLMVVLESIWIGLLGAAVGLVEGFLLSYYFQVHPIIWRFDESTREIFGLSQAALSTVILPSHYLYTLGLLLLLSLIGALAPARRASRLHPAEALRHV